MKRFSATLGSLAVLGLLALPGGAGAVTTPNGGAANMVNPSAAPGMTNAMSVNNPIGSQGMWCAVDITAFSYPTPPSPGSCPEAP